MDQDRQVSLLARTGIAARSDHSVTTYTSIGSTRRKRAVSRFCTECRTPWSLVGVRQETGYVVICKHCGHVRATIPGPRAAQEV
jgi:hypothetical protein